MFPLKRLEEEVNIISINPQRSAAAPPPHTSLSVPSIVFISPFLKWLSVCRSPPHTLSSSPSGFLRLQQKRCKFQKKGCIASASVPLPDQAAGSRSDLRPSIAPKGAVREVWRFYDSFMEPLAVYKVICRGGGGGGGEVTFSHSTNQAGKRQQVPGRTKAGSRQPSLVPLLRIFTYLCSRVLEPDRCFRESHFLLNMSPDRSFVQEGGVGWDGRGAG